MSSTSSAVEKYISEERGHMRDVLIRAGAGAGKTTELVRRVLSLAWFYRKKNGEWPRLVVTTFTRKATQELRERLMKAALEIADEELVQYIQASQNLQISTIHGVLTLLLRRQGRAIDLSPDFDLIDLSQDSRLRRRVLKRLISSDQEFLKLFMKQQEQFSLSQVSEMSSVLGAALLEHQDLEPWSLRDQLQENLILYNKFQDDISWILPQLEGDHGYEAWTACQNLFRKMRQATNLEAMAELMAQSPVKTPRPNKVISAEVTRVAKSLLGFFKETYCPLHTESGAREYEQSLLEFSTFSKVWEREVMKEKIFLAQMTMEDLELFSLELMNRDPAALARFSGDWDYWLIDEYQDTSPRQVRLLSEMRQQKGAFVVGDPQQSIYLFRGARSEVFHQAEDGAKARGDLCFELMTNYRTSRPVLEFLNDLFPRASGQLRGMDISKEGREIQTNPISICEVSAEDQAVGKPDLQVQAMANTVAEMIQGGVAPETICILMRTKKDLQEFAEYAQGLGLPVQIHTSGQYSERREVQDALLFLQFLVAPDDNLNLMSLLRSPWAQLPDSALESLAGVKGLRSVWQQLLSQRDDSRFSIVAQRLQGYLVQSKQIGVLRVWRNALLESGLLLSSAYLDSSGRREANLWKLIQSAMLQERRAGFRLTDFISQLGQAGSESEADVDASPVLEPSRVQLMTVHASKGLEFDHVLVPYLESLSARKESGRIFVNVEAKRWGLSRMDPEEQSTYFPSVGISYFETLKERSQAEMDRVVYVAMTRAKSSLHLYWSKSDSKSSGPNSWVQALARYQDPALAARFQVHSQTPGSQAFALELVPTECSPKRGPWVSTNLTPEASRRLTVSDVLERLVEKKALQQAKPSPVRPVPSLLRVQAGVRGARVHRFFESLKYVSQDVASRQEFESELSPFLASGTFEVLAEVIQNGEVEWGFATRLGKFLIQGQVDLWGRAQSGVIYVVDYKTGSPAAKERAFSQLEIYAWALQQLGKFGPQDDVRLLVVYPFEGQVIERKKPAQESLELALIQGLQ